MQNYLVDGCHCAIAGVSSSESADSRDFVHEFGRIGMDEDGK